MLLKRVTNVYGEEVVIDYDAKKLYAFSNKDKKVNYTVPIYENGEKTMFFTNFIEEGIVSNIEDKLNVWNSRLKLLYLKKIGFDPENNDPDETIWKKFVDFVKENEDRFFTKKGDFRKKFLISLEEIQNLKW